MDPVPKDGVLSEVFLEEALYVLEVHMSRDVVDEIVARLLLLQVHCQQVSSHAVFCLGHIKQCLRSAVSFVDLFVDVALFPRDVLVEFNI